MNKSIKIIKDQLTNIEHENLCVLVDNNLIADYCKQIRIEIEKIEANKLRWIKFSDKEPKKGEYVDIYSNARGRETDFEYEGDGTFYENNHDETRDVEFSKTETQYNVTHWMRIIDCL